MFAPRLTARLTPPPARPAPPCDPQEWVDRYGDALLRYAAGRVATRDEAEDLVQETFLAAYRHRAKFDGQASFGTWLVAILRRKVADHHRKKGRAIERGAETLDAAEGPFTAGGSWAKKPSGWRAGPRELAENAEFWRVFEGCLRSLPLNLAQAFQLREVGSMSVEEACRATGVTPQNLAVRLHRARLLLRECLETKWFRGPKSSPSPSASAPSP
jgi:RNA polymerase sigma-70 factor (ECF subfamily)